ncbi:MAG: MoxR family ATPase [Bacteroidia bacterium]|nr:MoxR family ATPase [Bacteroidia bacterium]
MEYTGEILKNGIKDKKGQFIYYPYVASNEIIDAVNLALLLNRPLLIKGEPGTGKSRLAESVALEFGHSSGNGYYEWFIKSSSRAMEGIYTFDNLARLRDAQIPHKGDQNPGADQNNVRDLFKYIEYGPLGRGFMGRSKPLEDDLKEDTPAEKRGLKMEKPPVVLIDEIDKADIDFPNDLLNELEKSEFQIRELQSRTMKAINRPLVIITSNDEKPLPPAFLRRCVFHYINFPAEKDLLDIVKLNYENIDPLVKEVTKRFLEIRDEFQAQRLPGKKPSTSELLDWVKVLNSKKDSVQDLMEKIKDKNLILYPGVLLKDRESKLHWARKKEEAANRNNA